MDDLESLKNEMGLQNQGLVCKFNEKVGRINEMNLSLQTKIEALQSKNAELLQEIHAKTTLERECCVLKDQKKELEQAVESWVRTLWWRCPYCSDD